MSLVINILHGNLYESCQRKKMQFDWQASIHDVLMSCKTKFPNLENMDQYGIFMYSKDLSEQVKHDKNPKKLKKDEKIVKYGVGRWLLPNKTLDNYDLENDDELWLRKKEQIVEVSFADQTKKKLLLDVVCNIRQLIINICEKLDMRHPEVFGLALAEQPTKYLNAKRVLYQICDHRTVLMLKKRLFLSEGEVDKQDSFGLHLTYLYVKNEVVIGSYMTNKDEITKLAALQYYIQNGPYNKDSSNIKKVNIADLAPSVHQTSNIVKEVYQNYQGLPMTMSIIDAKFRYMQLAMTLRSYGLNIYKGGLDPTGAVKTVEGKKPKLVPCVLAFNEQYVQVLTPNDYKEMTKEPYDHLKGWSFFNDRIILDFGEYNKGEKVVFYTAEGEDIDSLINGYLDIIVLRTREIKQTKQDIEAAKEEQQARERQTANKKKIARKVNDTENMQRVEIDESQFDIYAGAKSYALPVQMGMSFKVTKDMSEDDWRKMMRDKRNALLDLMKPIKEAIKGGNQKLEMEKAKELAVQVKALREAAMQGRLYFENPEDLINMVNMVMEVTNEYLDLLTSVSKDPQNNQLFEALEVAGYKVEVAIDSMIMRLSKRSNEFDEEVLLNFGNYIACLSEEVSLKLKDKSPETGQALMELLNEMEKLKYLIEHLGMNIDDAEAEVMIEQQMNRFRSAVKKVQDSLPDASEEDKVDMLQALEAADLLEQYLEQMKKEKQSKKNSYLVAAAEAIAASEHLALINNMRLEDVTETAISLKKTLPTIVKYIKEEMADPQMDDDKRQYYLNNLKCLTQGVRPIIENAKQEVYEADNAIEIQEAAILVAESLKELMQEDLTAMYRAGAESKAKDAISKTLRMVTVTKKSARGDGNKRFAERMLNCTKGTADAMANLLDALKEARDNPDDADGFVSRAKQFPPPVRDDLLQFDEFLHELEDLDDEVKNAKRDLARVTDQLDKNARNYEKSKSKLDIHRASDKFREAEAELRHAILLNEADMLDAQGLPDEEYEAALAENAELIEMLKEYPERIVKANTQREKIDEIKQLAEKSKKVFTCTRRAAVASDKARKKNLLEAAQKASNSMSSLLNDSELHTQGREDITQDKIEKDRNKVNENIEVLNEILRRTDDEIMDEEDALEFEDAIIMHEKEAAEKLRELVEEAKSFHKELEDKYTENEKRFQEENMEDDVEETIKLAFDKAIVALVDSTAKALDSALTAQEEMVSMLDDPKTRKQAAREPKYAIEMISALDETKDIMDVVKEASKDSTKDKGEVVKAAEKMSRKVERVVVATRAGVRSKQSSDRHKKLLEAAKKLGETTKALLDAADKIKEMEGEEEEIIVVPPPIVVAPPVAVKVDEDQETYGIDEFTLREIEQQRKIFELEKKLRLAKARRDEIERKAAEMGVQ